MRSNHALARSPVHAAPEQAMPTPRLVAEEIAHEDDLARSCPIYRGLLSSFGPLMGIENIATTLRMTTKYLYTLLNHRPDTPVGQMLVNARVPLGRSHLFRTHQIAAFLRGNDITAQQRGS